MKMKVKLIAVLLFIGYGIYAQTFDKARMDSLFTVIENSGKGMGSVSVFANGSEVYRNSIGYVSIEDNIPATGDTKYRIGSISKMYTAAIIIKLVEEGKLQLDSKLEKFFPGIKNSDRITIEHLLGHRSGIYNFTSASDYSSWMESEVSREDLVKKITSYPGVFEPGERSEYSNSNYVLLSYIAEKVTGREFAGILEDFITGPYNLANTYYGDGIDVNKGEAFSYSKLGRWNRATQTDMSIPSGAGAVVSTPTDVNLFLNILFQGKIVSNESLQKMMSLKDGFGLGMFQVPFYDKKAYGHTGGIDGFSSMAFYFPDEDVSVAYFSNGTDLVVNDIIIGVLSIYFGKDYELPVFAGSVEADPGVLDQYTGVYSTPDLPLKITITTQNGVLIGQGTGQPAFPLDAEGDHKFKFDQAMLRMEFVPEENKMILRQGGGEFVFKKE
jgi:D-alanyl-D-alanine carboxypeptidase